MELIIESDIYSPIINESGEYIDKIPHFNNIKNRLRCACGTRKDKTYDCYNSFSNHIKTKTHIKWLLELNMNNTNFFVENEKLKETIHTQKIIIAKFEKEINLKSKTIDYLTQQLIIKEDTPNYSTDLISFD